MVRVYDSHPAVSVGPMGSVIGLTVTRGVPVTVLEPVEDVALPRARGLPQLVTPALDGVGTLTGMRERGLDDHEGVNMQLVASTRCSADTALEA